MSNYLETVVRVNSKNPTKPVVSKIRRSFSDRVKNSISKLTQRKDFSVIAGLATILAGKIVGDVVKTGLDSYADNRMNDYLQKMAVDPTLVDREVNRIVSMYPNPLDLYNKLTSLLNVPVQYRSVGAEDVLKLRARTKIEQLKTVSPLEYRDLVKSILMSEVNDLINDKLPNNPS